MLEEKIKALFAAVLGVQADKINDLTDPASVEKWDSLNHLNLIVAFEEEFSIDIEPEEIPEMMKNFKVFKMVVIQKLSA